MKYNLLPCPFCGHDDTLSIIDDFDNDYAVCCDAHKDGCGATSGYDDSERGAVANWNTRWGHSPKKRKDAQ